jgi:hypothetical protein
VNRLFHLKDLFYLVTISTLLIFSVKFFQSTPFEEFFFEMHALFLVVSLIFVSLYIANNINKSRKINNNIKYLLLLMLLVPFYSATMAHIEFDQPILYGLLSQRGWAVIGAALFLYYLISTKENMLQILELSLVVLAWSSLLFFSYLYLTFDIESINLESNFAHESQNRGLRLKLNNYFITFGTLYYFIKFNSLRSVKYFLYFVLFALYIFFLMQGRMYLIQIITVILIYTYRSGNFSNFFIKTISAALILAGLIFSLYFFFPDVVIKIYDIFSQMLIVLGGNESLDSSSNSRIYQSAVALDYFTLNPDSLWLGVGKLSHHWNDGYQSIFGYFYPTDIGLLGGLFQFGVLGMIFIWLIPIFLSYKLIKSVEVNNLNLFLITLQYLLVYYMVKSINTGNYVFFMYEYILVFFILLGSKINKKCY